MSTWLLLLFLVAACGASVRERTIKGAILTVDTARIALEAWDGPHQAQIAREVKARGGTRADAEAAVAAHQLKVAPVYQLLAAAYAAIIATAEDDGKPVATMTGAVAAALAAYTATGAPPVDAAPAKGTP